MQQEILQGSAPYTGRANEKEAGSRYFRVEESYHYDGTGRLTAAISGGMRFVIQRAVIIKHMNQWNDFGISIEKAELKREVKLEYLIIM